MFPGSIGLQLDISVQTNRPFYYLTRFCFWPLLENDAHGNTLFKISFPNTNHTSRLTLLAFYLDRGQVVDDLLQDDLPCQEMLERAGDNRINLWTDLYRANSKYVNNRARGDPVLSHTAGKIQFGGSRSRFYHFVLVNCNDECPRGSAQCQGGVDAFVYMEMHNGDSQLSADEYGLYSAYAVFVAVYCVLAFVALRVKVLARRRKLSNPTIRLFVLVIWLCLFSMVFNLAHFSALKRNGHASSGLRQVAALVRIVADSAYVLVCVLFAKGWNVVRRSLSSTGQVRLSLYLSAYFTLALVAESFAVFNTRPEEVVYKFESVPGVCLVALRVVAFLWVAYATHTTIKNYWGLRRVFTRFLAVAAVWLLALPLTFLLALALPTWSRERLVVCFDLVLLCATQSFLLYQWWPNKDNGRFPFRILFHFNSGKTLPGEHLDLPNRHEIDQARDVAAMMHGHVDSLLRLLGQSTVVAFNERKAASLSTDDDKSPRALQFGGGSKSSFPSEEREVGGGAPWLATGTAIASDTVLPPPTGAAMADSPTSNHAGLVVPPPALKAPPSGRGVSPGRALLSQGRTTEP